MTRWLAEPRAAPQGSHPHQNKITYFITNQKPKQTSMGQHTNKLITLEMENKHPMA